MADVETTQPAQNGSGDPIIDDGEEAESKVLPRTSIFYAFILFFFPSGNYAHETES